MVLVALFTATFAAVRGTTHYRQLHKRQPNWEVVPYQIDRWSGFDGRFDPIYGADPSDTSLPRIYRKSAQSPVILYVGFFGDLATILEVHTPELCYPAQGWEILQSGKFIGEKFRGERIQARQILAEKAGKRRLVVWWYNAGSRPIETRIRHVYAMLAMSTMTRRTDGSMVRLETSVDEDGEAAAEKRIDEFQKSLFPPLDRALPL
jgi:EpsI family protein